MTNRDYINTLSNEEFAKYVYAVILEIGKEYTSSITGVAKWLSEPIATYKRVPNCHINSDSDFDCLKCGECGRKFEYGLLCTEVLNEKD